MTPSRLDRGLPEPEAAREAVAAPSTAPAAKVEKPLPGAGAGIGPMVMYVRRIGYGGCTDGAGGRCARRWR